MSTIDVSELLRPGLLQGVSIVIAGAPAALDPGESPGAAVRGACAELGARVSELEPLRDGSPGLEEAAIEQAVERVLADVGSVELLVVDGASLFAHSVGGGPQDARTALGACLDAAWNVTRALANRAFLPRERGGRIVFVAPPPDAGAYADGARAGLENLARTLSIEWARHAITVVAIAPGAAAGASARGDADAGARASEVGALIAYLASPAGAYFSGCLLDLRGAAGG